MNRIDKLSKDCVDMYHPDDIIEHLEEELAELLLAIKRVRRNREPLINMLEELTDVEIEINTVTTLLVESKQVTEEDVQYMFEKKLNKFDEMLFRTAEHYDGTPINRYKHGIIRSNKK